MRRLVSALVLFAASTALADLTLVNEVMTNGETRTVTLSAKGARAYFELKDPDGATRNMLRDSDQKKLYLINHEKKTVLVVTETDSKALEEKQAEFRAQMQAQLAKLPPEKRARMEATMLGSADAKAPLYTYEKKKSAPRKIGTFTCQDYVIKRDGAAHGEACLMSWKDAGLSADEFKALMVKALPTAGSSQPMTASFDAHAGAPGLPVWRKMVDAEGKTTSESTLKSFAKTALAAEKFELPKGYAEKSMAEMMRPPAPAPAPSTK